MRTAKYRAVYVSTALSALLYGSYAAAPSAAAVKKAVSAAPTAIPRNYRSWIGSQPDIDGHTRHAAELMGKVVCLYFFCGCDQCHSVASQWTAAEQGDATAPSTASKPPITQTVIAFTGSIDEAKQFASDTGIDKLQPAPIILVDPDAKLRPMFHISGCPQAFVISPTHSLAYSTLNIQDTQAVNPLVIVSNVLSAVRKAGIVSAQTSASFSTKN